MKLKLLYLITAIVLISLTACNLPIKQTPSKQQITQLPQILKDITKTPTTEGNPIVVTSPDCNNPISFGHTTGQSPANLSIEPLTPTYQWKYWPVTDAYNSLLEDPWAYVCVPDIHYIYLSTGPDFSDEIIHEAIPVISYTPGVINLEWTDSSPLEPLSVYRWRSIEKYHSLDVLFWLSGTLHEEFPSFHPYNQDTPVFRTGPGCTTDSIAIPTLISPAQGAVVTTKEPTFTWNVPDCMPDDFKIHVWSANGNFSLDGTTDVLWWNTYNENTVIPPLPDCTLLYWQVRGRMNTISTGSWSTTKSFYVNTGGCAPPPAPPAAPTKTPTATPKPASVNCSSYTDPITCNNHSECFWHIYPPTEFKPAVCEDKP